MTYDIVYKHLHILLRDRQPAQCINKVVLIFFRKWSEEVIIKLVKHLYLPQQGTLKLSSMQCYYL